jgi:hypothetical protein
VRTPRSPKSAVEGPRTTVPSTGPLCHLCSLTYIVQFRSRLTVFLEWAIEDLTFSRGARLITGSATTDFDFNREMASEAHPDEAA